MAPIVDFSEVKGAEPIPSDVYECAIETSEYRTSKTGNPKISVGWKVLDGPYAGRMVFDDISFAPNALPVTKSKLVGMGFDPNIQLDPEEFAPDLIGVTALVKVEIETSTDINPETGEVYDPRNRVRRIKKMQADVGKLLKKK